MPTSTVEDYVKHLFLLQAALDAPGRGLVTMGRLAAALDVVPGTATSMIKTLAEAGLVDYEPRAGVRLTGRGERLALHVVRRHRLVELFLVRILGMDWAEIHDEAERLEHAVSDRVLERIDALLGHPKADPHGDAIPDAAGAVPRRALTPLDALAMGGKGRVGRIADQADAFLQFVDQHGLRPGQDVTVVQREDQAGTFRVRLGDGREITLGQAAAAKIEVEAGS